VSYLLNGGVRRDLSNGRRPARLRLIQTWETT
jgi:hypothetical protein